ncbi:unnamed protein product [Clavelina lepadiformis]|uniref:EGF-like domain-containing protein n=1 Tax=Clavelina lepadiformis TaxID=159417 RepID=A0ABP0F0T7_CLALP
MSRLITLFLLVCSVALAYGSYGYDHCYNKVYHKTCHPNAVCKKWFFSYRCVCKKGFVGNGYHCQPICQCPPYSKCFYNILKGYFCKCNPGLIRRGKSCVDPCYSKHYQHGCHKHAVCKRWGLSYRCSCKYGYHGNGYDCKGHAY